MSGHALDQHERTVLAHWNVPEALDPPEYMTWARGRTPEYKTHKTLGQARSSFGAFYGASVPGRPAMYWYDMAMFQFDKRSGRYWAVLVVEKGQTEIPWKTGKGAW